MKFKQHPRYGNFYEVSDSGVVRSLDRTIYFSDGRIRRYKGRTLAKYKDGFGYEKVTLHRNSIDERAHVHVLVAETFLGKRPKGYQVRHLNGNHLDNRVANLCYGSSKENHGDMIKHGTKPHGEKHGATTLTLEDAKYICEMRGKITGRELAHFFGVSPVTICQIQLGRRWKYLKRRKEKA